MRSLLALPLLALLFTGCKPSASEKASSSGATPVSVQTDWYAQAEHGGFYQGVATGAYRNAGLEVEILQGGPSTRLVETVATGRATFGIGRSDDIMTSIAQGLPIVIVSALMQKDPQALLLHAENPISDFSQLGGKTVMTTPGAVWVQHLNARYGYELAIMPLDYGLARFMADKAFIQQCFVTNEPFYVRKAGGNPKTLLLSETGYRPYRVIFTSTKFVRENPETVRAFVHTSLSSWNSYLNEDPTAANQLILQRNENMTAELLAFAREEMKRLELVNGSATQGERAGLLRRDRLRENIATLVEFKILSTSLPLEKFVRFDFLPTELQALAGD